MLAHRPLTPFAVGPLLGISLSTNTITAFSISSRVSYTSKRDIGLSVAQLSVLASQTATPAFLSSSTHSHVRIAGYTANAQELAKDVENARRAKGDAGEGPKIAVKEGDLAAAKASLKEKFQSGEPAGLIDYLKCVSISPLLT